MAIVRRTIDLANLPPLTPEQLAQFEKFKAMTPEEIEQNALDDPDNPPWTEEEMQRGLLGRLGIRFVERDEFDGAVGDLGLILVFVGLGRGGGLGLRLEHRAREGLSRVRRDDRVLVQVIEFAARGRANALRSKFRFRHCVGPSIIHVLKSRRVR